METEIIHRHSNTAVKVKLNEGESCTTESGAMIAMSGNMSINTSTFKRGSGSILKAVKRMFAGESFFLNHFEPKGEPGEIWLGPMLSGDIMQYDLNGDNLIVQSHSFLAAESGVDMDVGWQGFKNMFSGESLFWIKLGGKGRALLSSFGAIYPVEVDGEYIVDTGHIVAFQESLNFTLSKAGSSWISSILGGEGLVCRFAGKGTVYCQSHTPAGFGWALSPFLKPRSS